MRVSSSAMLGKVPRRRVRAGRAEHPLSGEPPTNTQKEEDFREEGTLFGHGGLGGYADAGADRHGARADRENGSDGGEGSAPERWRSAGVVGPACCRPAYRRRRAWVRRPAS